MISVYELYQEGGLDPVRVFEIEIHKSQLRAAAQRRKAAA